MSRYPHLKNFLVRTYRPMTPLLQRIGFADWAKSRYELAYWRSVAAKEGVLRNGWYEALFTSHVGLALDFYEGKRILDVGCGPRGSLEWADMAAERVGLDPLVDSYRSLGIDRHKMSYVNSGSEDIPFPDGHFDVVLSLNSLDHVDDLQRTAEEVTRVTAPGGSFLLLVEIHHDATVAEPHRLDWDVVDLFEPAFQLEDAKHYEQSPKKPGVAAAIRAGVPFDHQRADDRVGVLAARLVRAPVTG